PGAARAVVAILGTVVLITVAPFAGARPEAGLVAVPALGMLAARAFRVPLDRTAALSVAIATALVSGVAVAWRRAALPRAIVRPETDVVWIAVIAVLSIPALVLTLRRRSLLARALWGRPALRVALAGSAIAVAGALVCGAVGTGVAGIAALIAASGFLSTLLAGSAGD
ncbi:MAG: hypothetical protein ACRDJM_01760, partial [Actinomycetota bacterium]